MCLLINLTFVSFNTYGEIINSVFLFLFTAICGLAPFVIAIAMSVKFDKLDSEEIKRKFGTLYENLNLGEGRLIVAVPTIFLVRRLLLGLSVVL